MSNPETRPGRDETLESLFQDYTPEEQTQLDRAQAIFYESVYAPFLIMWEDWRTRVGLIILVGFVLMGTVGTRIVEPTYVNHGPYTQSWFQSWEHPLGTDRLGHDILAMTVHATPAMLEMIAGGAIFAVAVATIVGTVSGYVGGNIDYILTMITDIVLNIPGLPLIIVLAAIFEPERAFVVGILLTINAWAGLARAIRSQVLTIRTEAYVEASFTLDMPLSHIVRKDIMPNLMPYILMNLMEMARFVIFASVALYFLGILPFTTSNWGVMMNEAYQHQAHARLDMFYWIAVPIVVIGLVSIGLILVAQGMDRVFNPRVRARYERSSGDNVPSQLD